MRICLLRLRACREKADTYAYRKSRQKFESWKTLNLKFSSKELTNIGLLGWLKLIWKSMQNNYSLKFVKPIRLLSTVRVGTIKMTS